MVNKTDKAENNYFYELVNRNRRKPAAMWKNLKPLLPFTGGDHSKPIHTRDTTIFKTQLFYQIFFLFIKVIQSNVL